MKKQSKSIELEQFVGRSLTLLALETFAVESHPFYPYLAKQVKRSLNFEGRIYND
jgi:hypothetical protein